VCTDVDSFSITGVINLESGLAAFPTPAVQSGDCFASVTGVVDYAFGYVLYHRSTDEIVIGGTGCVRESATGPTNLCTDGADNDGDGFKDCSDFDCEVGPGAWLGTSCAATGAVLLHDVIVTAVGPTGFWVADAAVAAQLGGVFVFTKTAPDASIVIGAKLPTLQGIVSVFNASKLANTKSVISINRPTAGTPEASGLALVPISSSTATILGGVTTGEPFAGSLVHQDVESCAGGLRGDIARRGYLLHIAHRDHGLQHGRSADADHQPENRGRPGHGRGLHWHLSARCGRRRSSTPRLGRSDRAQRGDIDWTSSA
jgi:hypothetical protein